MLQESFPPTTGTRFLGELHKTLTKAINDRATSPFQPSPVDTAANEDLARARAYQEVLGKSIRKSWYCIRSIIDQSGPDAHPVNLELLGQVMIGTPELMRANGLYLPLAIKVPIDPDMYGDMVRRYYSKPSISLGAPDSYRQSILLHAGTEAMGTIQKQRESLEALHLDPVFGKALDTAWDMDDAREFLLKHPDPRVPLLVTTIQEQMPDLFAAIYTVSHYLSAAESGARQAQGFEALEHELNSIRKIAGGIPLSDEGNLSLGQALKQTINTFPVEMTTPERFAALSQRLFADRPEPKSVFSQDRMKHLPEDHPIPGQKQDASVPERSETPIPSRKPKKP